MTTKTLIYEGVGRIHGRRGRWTAETIYGERKGPFREFDRAQDWMEIHWAQESKARAGVGWRDKTIRQYTCPECGVVGASSYVPLCHICNFAVKMKLSRNGKIIDK